MRRLWLATAILAGGCGRSDAPAPPASPAPQPPSDSAAARAGEGGPPADVGHPPKEARRAEGDVAVLVLAPGSGDAQVGPHDRVSVNYSTWLADGRLYFSTRTRRAPTTFELGQLSPGLRAGMLGMHKGERRRLWIPAAVARANERSPQGPVLTDVEVVALAAGKPPVPPPPGYDRAPDDAQQLPMGVRYRVLVPPTGDRAPSPHDRVTLRMTSWDATGKMLETSARHGGSDAMVAAQAPPGASAAIMQMKVGEKRLVWVPHAVVRTRPTQLTTGVVYEIELLELVDMPDPPQPPKNLKPPKTGVKKTASGVVYKVLKRGRGDRKPPEPKTKVDLHMSGWTSDGTLITSTVMNDRVHTARVRTLIGGLKEVVPTMVVGEKRRVWIPAKLAYEGMPAKPQGDVVFDVELAAIR